MGLKPKNFIETARSVYTEYSPESSYEEMMARQTSFPANSTTPATLGPGISRPAYLALTIVFTTLYALLFFMIVVQLCLILYHKHRRLSYQSVFLFIYLLWAALRTTLFSFYFKNSAQTKTFDRFIRWLLYAFPIYLQFLTLSLLTLYLAKVVLRTRRSTLEPLTFRKYNRLYLPSSFATVNMVFFALNITSSFVCHKQDAHDTLVILRVIVNGLLFVVVGVVLCFCIIKITRAPAVNVLLEGQGATTRQGILLCVLVVLLYLSRVVYNLIAVAVPHDLSSFGYGWINVSDEGEINYRDSSCDSCNKVHDVMRDAEFITFGVVLIVWEVLPTFMVILFFRVRRPNIGDMGPSGIASQSGDKKSYFFDNPRRYDSDEDLTESQGQARGSQYNIPGVLSPSASSGSVNRPRSSYGSISAARSGSFQRSNSYSKVYLPSTTPPTLPTWSENQAGWSGYQADGSGFKADVLVKQNEA
ncbi:integral membrane protein GPR137B-like isoform X1 [Pocillopora damicornis]|uniref:integral membrane protein GPR137B-like isoform X1 n=1 Tax=Pocillopora damicornis TaxID=46731 RepID=UPI000F5542F1|nr:integral membrane protein GPR137B-like isoform X1 [Pocillopora damicornis]